MGKPQEGGAGEPGLLTEIPARRILLVEDEPDIRESLQELIEIQLPDAKVTTAATGAEALRLLPTARPHLIITDFKMPGMNGLEFLAAARAQMPECPRILMTAFPDLEIATRAINEAHIENFLAKPIEPDELLAKMVRIFEMSDARHHKERALARTLRELQDAIETTKK